PRQRISGSSSTNSSLKLPFATTSTCHIAPKLRRTPNASQALSVGVASHIPGEADGSPDRLLGAADEALYAAKRLGRNRVICAERVLAEFAGLGRDPTVVPVPFRRKMA
ncbi:hypothetical protein QCM80_37140, partial [Bradyrhizobium sp. SSUT112]|nr:hypothetical protein [Bradyrhizobium sp. SSUT112]